MAPRRRRSRCVVQVLADAPVERDHLGVGRPGRTLARALDLREPSAENGLRGLCGRWRRRRAAWRRSDGLAYACRLFTWAVGARDRRFSHRLCEKCWRGAGLVAPRTRRGLVAPALSERGQDGCRACGGHAMLRYRDIRSRSMARAVGRSGGRALLTIDTGLEVPGGSQDTQQDEFDTQGDRPFDDAYGFNQPYDGAMSMPQMGDPLDLTDSAAFVGNRDARVTSLALTDTDTDISTNCTWLRRSTVRSCPK